MNLLWLAPMGAGLALAFVVYLIFVEVLPKDPGTEKMREIAKFVSEGAFAYLKRQYSIVGIFFLVVFLLLLWMVSKGYLVIFVPFAFLSGGFFSGLSGFIGMTIATKASNRTASAARKSLNQALRVAFSAGSVMGMTVVGLGLLDLVIWYAILDWYYSTHPLFMGTDKISAITSTMLCFGMGASSQALFARVGGGIFTKAADVGADLVGKVEAGIPEDDPRNPAVIADNVGDNVGDVAGMGADLFESYVESIVAAMVIGFLAYTSNRENYVLLPLAISAAGILGTFIGNIVMWAARRGSPPGVVNLAIAV